MSEPIWWDARFKNLPVIQLSSYQYPSYDGDMAQLHELADRVLAHADTTLTIPVSSIWHYRKTIDYTGINPHQLLNSRWDTAADMLKKWDQL